MATAHCISLNPSIQTELNDFSRYLCARLALGDVTAHNHVSTIRRLEPILGMKPSLEEIEDHLLTMRRGGASYAHLTNTSVALERYMAFIGTPVKLARPKKPRRLIRGCLTEAEVTLWINAAANLREKAILCLLAFSGIRPKELCHLTIGDIDVANQRILITDGKGHKDRDASITPSCICVMVEYLRERGGNPGDMLFVTTRAHAPYQQQNLRKLARKAAKRAGISKRVFPYLLRHSLATNLLHRGAHLMAIKDQLGHAYVETTLIYLHSDASKMQMQYRMYAPSYL